MLVIEDDTASRLAIVRALRESQHTVFEAADGVAGLEIAKTEPLDAVVLDLMLPRMDGIRLLTELRRTSRVPVIVVSARRTEDDRVEALDRGEVVPRDVLEKAIRQDGSAHVSNVVDVIILRLRRKLGRELIATRRGQGFIIELQDGRG